MTSNETKDTIRTFSTMEVAGIIGCGEKTVRFLEDSGQLKSFWVSGRRRVKESDLVAFMAAGGQKFSKAAYDRSPKKYAPDAGAAV